MLGFPIRTSPDQSQVGDSPGLNAASHVLHRLLMPRHPPCALKNLATKMLASTMQISNNKQRPKPAPPPNTHREEVPLIPGRAGLAGGRSRTRSNGPPLPGAESRPPPTGSGPDMVRFLRTQQCVRPARPPAAGVPTPTPPRKGRRY